MDKFCNEACFRFFNALANRTRLAIVDSLSEAPQTAGQIAKTLKQDPEVVSQYLELMAGCKLLRSEGLGKDRRYTLNYEIFTPLANLLASHMANCCPGLKKVIPDEKLREYQKREAAKEKFLYH